MKRGGVEFYFLEGGRLPGGGHTIVNQCVSGISNSVRALQRLSFGMAFHALLDVVEGCGSSLSIILTVWALVRVMTLGTADHTEVVLLVAFLFFREEFAVRA